MDVFKEIEALQAEIEAASLQDADALDAFRIKYLGSKGVFKQLFGKIGQVPNEQKREFGQRVNQAKQLAEGRFKEVQARIHLENLQQVEQVDMTAPGEPNSLGARHPVALIMNKIISIFERIGFTVVESREIENDWYNFSALNLPEDHPARDMQDTYYLQNDLTHMLRTHTSNTQIHTMEERQPPIRVICPGRVYRNETVSARSHCQFHQIEGLYVAENVSFADLRQTITYFAKEMFGSAKIRLRPSYFPFTEPSAEVDVYWGLNSEADYRLTKGTGWLEILGCGMVDPKVLQNCGIDPERYSGFAFGLGIERIALQQFQIDDIRLLFENDVRFLDQFKAAF